MTGRAESGTRPGEVVPVFQPRRRVSPPRRSLRAQCTTSRRKASPPAPLHLGDEIPPKVQPGPIWPPQPVSPPCCSATRASILRKNRPAWTPSTSAWCAWSERHPRLPPPPRRTSPADARHGIRAHLEHAAGRPRYEVHEVGAVRDVAEAERFRRLHLHRERRMHDVVLDDARATYPPAELGDVVRGAGEEVDDRRRDLQAAIPRHVEPWVDPHGDREAPVRVVHPPEELEVATVVRMGEFDRTHGDHDIRGAPEPSPTGRMRSAPLYSCAESRRSRPWRTTGSSSSLLGLALRFYPL